MKWLKNKSGSVLILVVLVIGVLSIIGTSVLSAALSNYKMKVTSTVLKTNLYIAEAGFEETYGKIYNIVVSSISTANESAKNKIKSYDETLFNQTVMKISSGEPLSNFPFIMVSGSEYVYNNVFIEQEAKTVFLAKYKDEVERQIRSFTVSCAFNPAVVITATKLNNDSLSSIAFGVDDKITIKLTSEYNDARAKRKASVNLDILLPTYYEPYTITVEGKQLPINPLWTKAVATDGELSVDSATVINGAVFSNGRININKDLSILNNTATNSDFIVNGSNVNINIKDIYANNVLLNAPNIEFIVNSNDLDYGGMYIVDDFEMNNINQRVTINNSYFGFSDGSAATGNTPDQSSGIIINSDDIQTSSSFTLNGILKIYGTSYINLLTQKYQTGESISVKGNYIAYSMPISSGEYMESNIKFNYIDPLMLATQKLSGGAYIDMNVYDKNKYFYEYYNENKTLANKGGLKLDNINISGAITAIGDIIKGSSVEIGEGLSISAYEELFKEYAKIHKLKTLTLGDKHIAKIATSHFPVINVNNDVDFAVHASDVKDFGDCTLIYEADGRPINIVLDSNTKFYFVVTNGTVNISGDGNLSGCIIAKGGVNISGTRANISYNERVVLKAFTSEPWLQTAFKVHPDAELKNYTVTSTLGIDAADTTVTNIDYSGLLKFKNWKIKYD